MRHGNGKDSPPVFFATYVGPSMNPTLRDPALLEIEPYGNRPVRVGDVVFFLSPEADQPIVHRVIRMTPAGISTLGDNNTREDAFLLQPENIQGQVVAAWRGQHRRRIAGGLRGRVASRGLRWGLGLCRSASPVLQPLYHALSRRGWVARCLPTPFRPRVVVFRAQGRDQYQLLLGRRVIGRYDNSRHQWQIQRPFHLLVDGRSLPGQQETGPSMRPVLTQRQRTFPFSRTQDVLHTLALADGCRWDIAAADEKAALIVSQLGCAMQLSRPARATEPFSGTPFQLLVHVDAFVEDCYIPLASQDHGRAVVSLYSREHGADLSGNFRRLSLVFARAAQASGGFLIHGALAEKDGRGVILAAPGGTGKTTASGRLPAPWRSLSDDITLVVRDPQGRYWAHPWPTWSRFQDGGPGGTWEVQHAVPLKGIFILSQAPADRAERIGSGQAVSLLMECAGQTSMFMIPGLLKEEVRALHLERFNNLCALARIVPTHLLHISLTGTFWNEIERSLEVRAP